MDSGQSCTGDPFNSLARLDAYPTPPPSYSQRDGNGNSTSYLNISSYSSLNNALTPLHDIYFHYAQNPDHMQSVNSLSPPLNQIQQTEVPQSVYSENDTVSISTAFHPNAHPVPDTVFISSDNVFFYAHSPTILASCPSSFHSYISAPLSSPKYRNTLIRLDLPAVGLNVVLHALYGTSPASFSPEFDTLARSIDHMPKLSMSPEKFIRPSTPLYDLFLNHAPLHPLEIYTLAAHHKIHTLAVHVSSHLLAFDLSTITDKVAERMGSIYLKKLLVLHSVRASALKNILLRPPHPHPQTKQCGFEDQRNLTRAWALVSAYLAFDASPDLSTHRMKTALNPLMEHLTCEMCHKTLEDRIKDAVVQWSSVKRTI